MAIAATPAPRITRYIFTSLHGRKAKTGYGKMAEAMEKLAAAQPGF